MVTEWIIRPSKFFVLLTLLFYMLAGIALSISSILLIYKLLLSILLVADGFRLIYFKRSQRSSNSVIRCIFKEKRWFLFDQFGNMRSVDLLSSTVVLPQCVVLYFKGIKPWQYYTVAVFKDAVESAEAFRRLKAFLRFGS